MCAASAHRRSLGRPTRSHTIAAEERSRKKRGFVGRACAGLSGMLQYAVGALFLGVTGWALYAKRSVTPVEFPGGLEAEGDFESVFDFDDGRAVDERKRDFARLVKSRQHLFAANGGAPRLVDGGVAPCETFDECARVAADALGPAGASVAAWAYVLLSATTPFEWAEYFGVTPHFGESRYILVGGERPRVAWCALLGTGAPGAWPFFVALLSEPLDAEPMATTKFRYFCEPAGRAPSLPALADAWFASHADLLAGAGPRAADAAETDRLVS